MTDFSFNDYPNSDEPTRCGDRKEDVSTFEVDQSAARCVPEMIGDYAIRHLIASGGMGQVYLAEQTRMDRLVAIKMLPTHLMSDRGALARFREEIVASSGLIHPNIVTAFDAGQQNGIDYLVMQYIHGETLTQIVDRSGPLTVAAAAATIRQGAIGLLHAHKRGIVHRDVKPGNFMRDSNGIIKVLDLGLARVTPISSAYNATDTEGQKSATARRGELIGTLSYMSPEQLDSPDDVDERSDIYSLGATLFFLLTGHPPFTGDHLKIVHAHQHRPVPDLRQLREDVDQRLNDTVGRMMAKLPDQRFQTLHEVVAILNDYVDDSCSRSPKPELPATPCEPERTTRVGNSTSRGLSRVMSIDLGMFYSATAEMSATDRPRMISAGCNDEPTFRMAIATEKDRLLYGRQAISQRSTSPSTVVHCIPYYLGKRVIKRSVAGQECPPEVLLALMLRRIIENSWNRFSLPDAVAITVPSCFDQRRRHSVLQAASLAGLKSVRLVSRGLAAVEAVQQRVRNGRIQNAVANFPKSDAHTLYVSLTGLACEAAVVRCDDDRLAQLSSAGQRSGGMLSWLHQLVELSADKFLADHQRDPRQTTSTATQLQISCEQALARFIDTATAVVSVRFGRLSSNVVVSRQEWLERCKPLLDSLTATVDLACANAAVEPDKINQCVLLGEMLNIGEIRRCVSKRLSSKILTHSLAQTDAAIGAAVCLAAELPGRQTTTKPPRDSLHSAIGVLAKDSAGQSCVHPIFPRDTPLPSHKSFSFSPSPGESPSDLTVVESAGLRGERWQRVCSHELTLTAKQDTDGISAPDVEFEVDHNGMLSARLRSPNSPTLQPLVLQPTPIHDDDKLAEWADWMRDVN